MGQATLDDYQSTASESAARDKQRASQPVEIGNREIERRIAAHNSTPSIEGESMDVPAVAPIDRNNVRAESEQVNDEELQEAVTHQLEQMDSARWTRVPDWVTDLPQWLDEDAIPDASSEGPHQCDNCGGHRPTDEPLERGRELALAGDDGNPTYDPCPPGKYNIESCSCCGCPECYCKSIYARESKRPRYRCRNPDCGLEFEHPIELPLNPADIRRRLYWVCADCGHPNLAPFTGIPELNDLLD